MIYIVPSRGRPHKVQELIDAWAATRTFAELFIVVDEDDPTVPEYRKIIRPSPTWVNWLVLESTEATGMVDALNFGARRFMNRHGVIGFMGDDHRPRTAGWDRMIHSAHLQGGLVMYGNDLLQQGALPTAVAMDSRIIQRLGYMAPPRLKHLYVDNFWRTLGQRLDRLTYIPDCVIEHMHPIAGKTEWDAEYVRVNDGALYADDYATYTEYVNDGQFDDDLKKLEGL